MCEAFYLKKIAFVYTPKKRFGGVPKLAKSTHHKETTNQQKTLKKSANSTGSPLGRNAANVFCFDLLRHILLGKLHLLEERALHINLSTNVRGILSEENRIRIHAQIFGGCQK